MNRIVVTGGLGFIGSNFRTQNCHAWYFVMAVQSIPAFVPIMGLAHRILKRVYDRGDCFYSCVLVYDTTQTNTNPLRESEMETCAVVGP